MSLGMLVVQLNRFWCCIRGIDRKTQYITQVDSCIGLTRIFYGSIIKSPYRKL